MCCVVVVVILFVYLFLLLLILYDVRPKSYLNTLRVSK